MTFHCFVAEMPGFIEELNGLLRKYTPEDTDRRHQWKLHAQLLGNWFQVRGHAKYLARIIRAMPDTVDLPSIWSPEEAVAMLVDLGVSRRGYRKLLASANKDWVGHRRLLRLLPGRRRVQRAWLQMAAEQKLTTVKLHEDNAIAVYWPWDEWLRYLETQPILMDALAAEPDDNTDEGLVFIVRGDGFPVAGSAWTQLNVTLRNFGRKARSTSHTFVIGLAYRDDKDMDVVGRLFRANLQVWLIF